MTDRRGSDPIDDGSHLVERETTLRDAVIGLDNRVRSMRMRNRVLLGSVILDLALTVGFFVANDRTNDAVHQVEMLVAQVAEASSAQRAACLAANESALAQQALWQGILALPKSPDAPTTPPEVLAEFDRLLVDTFAQRDCDA